MVPRWHHSVSFRGHWIEYVYVNSFLCILLFGIIWLYRQSKICLCKLILCILLFGVIWLYRQSKICLCKLILCILLFGLFDSTAKVKYVYVNSFCAYYFSGSFDSTARVKCTLNAQWQFLIGVCVVTCRRGDSWCCQANLWTDKRKSTPQSWPTL